MDIFYKILEIVRWPFFVFLFLILLSIMYRKQIGLTIEKKRFRFKKGNTLFEVDEQGAVSEDISTIKTIEGKSVAISYT